MWPELKDPPPGLGTRAPTCDRCGRLPESGFVLSRNTLNVVCTTCLSSEEAVRLGAGEDPFEEE